MSSFRVSGRSTHVLGGSVSQVPRVSRRSLARLALGAAALSGCEDAGTQPWPVAVSGGAQSLGEGPRWLHAASSQLPGEDWGQDLAMRGHGVAIDPRGQHQVLVARRPGNLLWIRSHVQQTVQIVQAPAYRHYLGHAVYDPTGRYLYVTENVFADYDPTLSQQALMREAVLGVYDRDQGYARVREIPAHGVGSHELRWMPDGQHLVVANGGIYTHPAVERETLNPDHLVPNLAYVHAQSGELVDRVTPADARMSLRHLCVHDSGLVVIGVQHQGTLRDDVPLVVSHQRGQALRPWAIPKPLKTRLKQYTASVEVHHASAKVAVSAPKGNAVLLFGLSGQFEGHRELVDAAGLGVCPQGFVASSGSGNLELLSPDGLQLLSKRHWPHHAWDNHLAVWPFSKTS